MSSEGYRGKRLAAYLALAVAAGLVSVGIGAAWLVPGSLPWARQAVTPQAAAPDKAASDLNVPRGTLDAPLEPTAPISLARRGESGSADVEYPSPTTKRLSSSPSTQVPNRATIAAAASPGSASTPGRRVPAESTADPLATSHLTIQSFSVDAVDSAGGKRLTFSWRTRGAVEARIFAGTSVRFPRWWDVDPEGSLTVELANTQVRNPEMQLQATNAEGSTVSESIALSWDCEHPYFFTPSPKECAAGEPLKTRAAEQAFEGGRMLWLEQLAPGRTAESTILVLYSNGTYEAHPDPWSEGEPEDSNSDLPPDGLYRPQRGFGKLWGQIPRVRDELGWALAAEEGFQSVSQRPIAESISGSRLLLRSLDGEVLQLWDWNVTDTGSWEILTP